MEAKIIAILNYPKKVIEVPAKPYPLIHID